MTSPQTEATLSLPAIEVFGARFDAMQPADIASTLARRARQRAAFAYVTAPDLAQIERLAADPELRPASDHAWLRLCAHRTLGWASWLTGRNLPPTPARDLVADLFTHAIDPEDTVLVIGGTADTIHVLRANYALHDVRWHDLAPELQHKHGLEQTCADFVANNPAHWIFINAPSPQQEQIALTIARTRHTAGVGLCLGDGLTQHTGQTRPAPLWRTLIPDLRRIARLWRATRKTAAKPALAQQ